MVRAPIPPRKQRAWTLAIAAMTLLSPGCDMRQKWTGPRTEAEASNYQRTSTSTQVGEFIAACAAHSPILEPLVIGESTKKKPLHLVLAADPPVASLEAARKDPRLKVVVMANIHAGEVEGKEAVLAFVREIAEGGHDALLRGLVVAFIPNYNPDGNDEIERKHRPDQAGPVEGVGNRHNGGGLDLNRDYVKVEAPETEALIKTVRVLDAVLVVDCHATDGSFHGFDLTYAGPLHPATDPGILDFERKTFLPALQDRMRTRHGFETFDYGNWVDEKNPAAGWETFEGRPRFGNSYFGLRNRLTLLSEAYSHDPFEKRIRSTHALIEEGLGLVVEHEATIRKVVAEADGNAVRLSEQARVLPTCAKLAQTETRRSIPVGSIREEKDPVTGLVRQWDSDVSSPVAMPVFAWFEGANPSPLRAGWIVRSPSQNLLRLLEVHGVEAIILDRDRRAHVETAGVASVKSLGRFQGHELKAFEDSGWQHAGGDGDAIPKGALYVPAAQPLVRLAFVMFEPASDDGLGTWGLLGLEAGTKRFEALHLMGWADK